MRLIGSLLQISCRVITTLVHNLKLHVPAVFRLEQFVAECGEVRVQGPLGRGKLLGEIETRLLNQK